MTAFDDIYLALLDKVIVEGAKQDLSANVRAKYADGTPALTRSIEGVSFVITPEDGVPILQSKRVGVKTPLIEAEWIWQEKSNDVRWLQERGVKIWNEWMREDGTIGRAYGYQMRSKLRAHPKNGPLLDQVEMVEYLLKNDPNSRRIMTSLWGVDDLDDMALEPCVWATHWTVHDGRLNLHVKQRSCDATTGFPYNVYQYHVIHAVMAKTVGLPLGNMYWNIDNLHIYERHILEFKKQALRYYKNQEKLVGIEPCLDFSEITFDTFGENRLSKVKLVNYTHLGNYSYEIAI